jgi:hypothetical protein
MFRCDPDPAQKRLVTPSMVVSVNEASPAAGSKATKPAEVQVVRFEEA